MKTETMTDPASKALASRLMDIRQRCLPTDVIDAAKGRLLHALGISLVNSRVPTAAVAWRAVAQERGPCLALGHRTRLSAGAATFSNSVAGYASLQEDTGFLRPMHGGGHPGTYVIPAALAAGQIVEASGSDLLCGIVIGYEIVDRLFAAAPIGEFQRLFSAVPLLGPFGAASAAAAIYDCDTNGLVSAIAIAANAGGGIKQAGSDGTMEFYFNSGLAARNGLLAADLAAAGAVTSSHSLDGPVGFFETFAGGPAQVDVLGAETNELAVSRIGTKRFPSCLQNQETIALIVAQSPPSLGAADIERITLYRSESQRNGINVPGVAADPPFGTAHQAQMSARFTAAAAALGRQVDDIQYFLSAPQDDEAMALAGRVELVTTSDEGVSVDITLSGGTCIELRADMSKVLFPSSSEIRERFITRAASVLGNPAAESVAELVDELESLENINELTTLLESEDD
jgi:2-methylcitrate dehydratase PrpD